MNRKTKTWKIELEFVDKGDYPLSNLITGKNNKTYWLARDIREHLNYFFRKGNDAFKTFKVKNLKEII